VLEGSDSAMQDEHGEHVQAETRCDVQNEDEKERRDLGLATSIKNFPTILRDQILDGRLLGRGTSCSVYEVRGFRKLSPLLLKAPRMKSHQFDSATMERIKSGPVTEDNLTNSVDSQQVWIQAAIKNSTRNPDEFKLHDEETLVCEAGEFIVDHYFRNGGDAPYAIKVLSPTTIDDPQRLAQGLMDLSNEANVLSHITDHPNIIKMRAMCQEDPYGESDNIFILLDRLYDTLEKRLKTWGCDLDQLSDVRARLFRRDPSGTKKAKLYEKRLKVACDLSGAIIYIHQNHMIHRDLKPENMGFDARGVIKVRQQDTVSFCR
jgi:serine/threonine protein kinase